jgi:hypothetical protein
MRAGYAASNLSRIETAITAMRHASSSSSSSALKGSEGCVVGNFDQLVFSEIQTDHYFLHGIEVLAQPRADVPVTPSLTQISL